MIEVNRSGKVSVVVGGLLLLCLSYVPSIRSAELTPYVVSGTNSRVEFEESRADDEKTGAKGSMDTKSKRIDLQLGIGLVFGTNFGNVDIVNSVEYTAAGDAVIDDSDAEDYTGLLYLHRGHYHGCRDEYGCFGWGPYVGLITKPSGALVGGWSAGLMASFSGVPGVVGFGYVVRQDVRYLVTDNATGRSQIDQKDFEGFAVSLGLSF